MSNRQIVKDALKCDELRYQLEDIDCVDFKCNVNDFDDDHIIKEAKYKLECFAEGGHVYNDMLNSDDPSERAQARKEKKQIERFLKKYA